MRRWIWCFAIVAYAPFVAAFDCRTLPVEAKSLQGTGQAQADGNAADFLDARFGRFEENFGVYGRMRNNGWAQDDDPALRGHFSFAFKFCEGESSRIFFSYTGEFDFYVTSRTSGPVINRLNNPALHWRLCDNCRTSSYTGAYLDIGLEHRSNGQVGDVTSEVGVRRARLAYEAQDREYFDAISRGSNYLSITNYQRLVRDSSYLRSRLKLYLSKDSQVTWGPLANSKVSISDYDRLGLLIRQRIPFFYWPSMAEAEWTVGDKGFKTDSLTLGWYVGAPLPLYVRAHFGPMNTLSNYTQRQDGIWLGVRFDWDGTSAKAPSVLDLRPGPDAAGAGSK